MSRHQAVSYAPEYDEAVLDYQLNGKRVCTDMSVRVNGLGPCIVPESGFVTDAVVHVYLDGSWVASCEVLFDYRETSVRTGDELNVSLSFNLVST